MTTLRIDIETHSSEDLLKVGVYKYVEAPDFEILMIGYAYDDGPVEIIDLHSTGGRHNHLNTLIKHIQDPTILKTAFNANFETTCLSKHFDIDLDPKQWQCTAVHALQLGLPRSLKDVAKALRLEEQKDTEGKALINYFSKPCKPTKTNGGRTRNLPHHDPIKWAKFLAYCQQDVTVEREIAKRLERFPVKASEWELWQLDQKINGYGVRIDVDLVDNAVAVAEEYTAQLTERSKELTGLENPNSIQQLKGWIEDNEGIEVLSVTKESIEEMMSTDLSDMAREVLTIRQELGKASVSKYEAMQRAQCSDGRVRGLLQFYGANRTGRWAGRLIQVQNLTKHTIADLDSARDAVKIGDVELLTMLYGDVQDLLSQLVRTAFVADPGSRFIVSDFSAIEARVIAWLAGEQWRLDVFNTHGKIYEASASKMFGVPLETIKKDGINYHLRAKGKVAELALGYQGGPGALINMGALSMGLVESELKPLVDQWRKANPAITKLWSDLEEFAVETVRTGNAYKYKHGIVFSFEAGCLFIQLPSGRRLCYARASLQPDPRFGRDQVVYWGTDTKGWTKLNTYGGKLTENVVQAIARDCLAESLIKLDRAGYKINFHVHDEAIIEEPYSSGRTKHDVMAIMAEPVEWAPGLPLNADAFETQYYIKD
jgi:DNA polymerase